MLGSPPPLTPSKGAVTLPLTGIKMIANIDTIIAVTKKTLKYNLIFLMEDIIFTVKK